jgi:hypothetical protein
MRQVNRTAAISSLTPTIARTFFIKKQVYHSFERTADWPPRLAGAASRICVSFAFRHRRFKRDQAAGKAGLRLASGGNPADNRRERQ